MIYSHSRLTTFEQCPYKYKLKYIDKVEPEITDFIETFLGTRVHETLEKLYKDLDHQKKNTIEELIDFYNKQWGTKWSDNIVIIKQDYEMKHYQKMGEKYIHDYYQEYFPFDHDKTIAIEEQIIFDLDDFGKYKIQGYIDRLAELKEGHYVIHDYKTNEQIPNKEYFKHDRQLALYSIGVKYLYHNVNIIDLTWHFLKFNKEIKSKRSEHELEKLKIETIILIRKIEHTTTYSPKPSFLCNWCEYKSICPQWSHLYILNEKTENVYLNDPGSKLVDRYAELKMKTNQMKLGLYAELEKIEEAIITFAEKENIEVVYGSENKVRIKNQRQYSVPAKGSAKRKQLEQAFKKLGKWDEVEQLDTNSLNKILLEKLWDENLISTIIPFLRYSEKKRLYLSKKKSY